MQAVGPVSRALAGRQRPAHEVPTPLPPLALWVFTSTEMSIAMKRAKRSKAMTSPEAAPVKDFSIDDLTEQANEIYDHVAPYLGRVNAVTQILENVSRASRGDQPSKESLIHAIREFSRIPEHLRDACFNGWRVSLEPLPREQMIQSLINEWRPIYRMLEICAAPDHVMEAQFGYFFCDRVQPVRIQIRQGAKLEDVLFSLQRIEKRLREHWARFITTPLEVAP